MGAQLIPEATYYARHFRLPGFGPGTQERLSAARVLVVGVGGLGCPIALYLARAGVGHIALMDGDAVSATNIHRQVLFDPADVDAPKVAVAARRLREGNPHVRISELPRFATREELSRLAGDYDVVVDGTDNFDAKFDINDACAAAGVPLVYGSIFQFEGQVSVFHHPDAQGRTTSYRDLYPEPPPGTLRQNCGEAGVIGVLPGIIGTLQANEVIKLITGLGEPLAGRLLTFDALSATAQTLRIARRDAAAARRPTEEPGIDHETLQRRLKDGPPVVLVDVREPNERAAGSIGGLHIPLAELPGRLGEIPDGDLVVYCKSGARSERAALYLRSVRRGGLVLNLLGGMDGLACRAG